MAQTALAVYAGAQMMSSIQKLFGIAVGLVYGMRASMSYSTSSFADCAAVIWYIGAANGPGSPYGIGAATVVLMTPVLAVRIFAPLASTQIAIQLAVTAILVVGTVRRKQRHAADPACRWATRGKTRTCRLLATLASATALPGV